MASEISLYRFGVFELETHTGELRRDGIKLKLQDQPFQVLVKLLQHPGEIVAREELRSGLWPADTFVDFETGLNTAIKRLRETLGDSADNPTFIETVPRRGYRFIAPVKTVGAAAASVAEEMLAAPCRSRIWASFRLGAVIAFSVVLLGFSLKHLGIAGGPPERVPSFTQITNDGQAKIGPLLSDGSRIYFSEILPSGQVLAEVSANGGETLPIPTSLSDPKALDLSPDRTELLALSAKGAMAKENLRGMDLWIVPVSGGSARPVGNVKAQDAIWGRNEGTILYALGHDIFVVNQDGSNPRKILSVEGYPVHLRWSPDKERLRFTMMALPMTVSSSLWEVAADGSGLHAILPGWEYAADCCGAWTVGARDFIFQSFNAGRTDLWDLTEERGLFGHQPKPVRLTAGPMNFSQAAAGRSRGEIFSIGSLRRAELVKYERKSGEFAPFLSGISAEGVDVSRDGRWIAYTTFPEGMLWRCNTSGGERRQLTFAPMRALLPHWSPDGGQITFIGTGPGNHFTNYLISAAGGAPRQLAPGDEQTADATWAPDGKSIVYGPWKGSDARGIKSIDLNTNKVSAVDGGKDYWSPRVSPDGRYIAAMTQNENKIVLFDNTTGKWSEIVGLYCNHPSWSRDGKFIYFQDWTDGAGSASRIARVRISDHQVETVLDLRNVDRLAIGSFVTWSGLSADGSVLLARDISAQEIYSLKW